jgi:hypothetical protein
MQDHGRSSCANLELVALEIGPLLRTDPRSARDGGEARDGLGTGVALEPEVVCAARVVALLDGLDVKNAEVVDREGGGGG